MPWIATLLLRCIQCEHMQLPSHRLLLHPFSSKTGSSLVLLYSSLSHSAVMCCTYMNTRAKARKSVANLHAKSVFTSINLDTSYKYSHNTLKWEISLAWKGFLIVFFFSKAFTVWVKWCSKWNCIFNVFYFSKLDIVDHVSLCVCHPKTVASSSAASAMMWKMELHFQLVFHFLLLTSAFL